ncbi:MAG: hypothetical protein QG653_120 [Patescibacteria group bacterium]|nr:hypothetical protein [Patescibacteria group bacterium]
MKLVLDFDEVLFKTREMKGHFTRILERLGVDPRMTELLYMKHRETGIPFSLKRFLWAVAIRTDIGEVAEPHVYEEIMKGCATFTNHELVRLIKPFGRENIIILTNGDKEYQMEKIKRSIGEDFASDIIVVKGSKKEALHTICKNHNKSQIIFVEDQPKFLDDLDVDNVKNLTTILFGMTGVEDVKEAIKKHSHHTKKRKH